MTSRKKDGNKMLAAMIDACNSKYIELQEEDKAFRMRGSLLFNTAKERRAEQSRARLRKVRIDGLRDAGRLLVLLQNNEDLLVKLLADLEERSKADRDRRYKSTAD